MSLPRARFSFLRALVAWGTILIATGVPASGPETLSSGPRGPAPASIALSAQTQESGPTQENPPNPEPRILRKQRQELLKFNLDKMKRDVDEMADLAKSLQEDLRKANQNVLSLTIVQRAEKIEKLAKRIKETARGY